VRAVSRALPQLTLLAADFAAVLRGSGRVFYVGAGTSGRLGALDAAELPPTFGLPRGRVRALLAGGARAMREAVEGAEDDGDAGARAVGRAQVSADDLVIGLTASGGTPFVRGALEEARRRGARLGLITSNPHARLRVLHRVVLDTGPELLAGSTRLKAGTGLKMALNAVSTAALMSLGKVYAGRMVDVRPTNRKLRARALAMVEELTGISRARCTRLLQDAGGSPKVALAMHLGGLSRGEAEAALAERTLGEIAQGKRVGRARAGSRARRKPLRGADVRHQRGRD
jgi:N-acetylmuramic acid 6-phosphate etherase